jgi:23S rRNA pseudouridine1911/1915/1917 synthase
VKILYEDDYILAVHKEAGIATQTSKLAEKDLYSEVMNYLSSKGKKDTIGIIGRLDQPVSGIVLFAKDSKITAAFTKLMNEAKPEKYYLARVYGGPKDDEGTLTDYLRKDAKTNSSIICKEGERGAKKSILQYKVAEREGNEALLDIKLITGRHHQIRLQCSNAGYPLLGDRKYGSEKSIEYSMENNIKTVALRAYKMVFPHPVTGETMTITDEEK